MEKRLGRISLLFGLLLVGLIGFLGYRLIVAGPDLAQKPFYDVRLNGLMEELIAEGDISLKDGQAHLDEERLTARLGQGRLFQRVKAHLAYVYPEGGRPLFDRSSTKVINPRLSLKNDEILRGRILDRHGLVLAESVRDKAARRQRRVYPLGPAGLHVVGYSHPAYGRRNLEKALDPVLLGRTELSFWQQLLTEKEENLGDTVVLTIDRAVQQKAFDLLAGRPGAVVALAVKSGEILALVSSPSFDPATPSGIGWHRAARTSADKPFLNRAIAGLYPPGSTFKLIDAAAWLDLHPDESFATNCTGRDPRLGISNYRGRSYGRIGLKEALAVSSNVYFARLGLKLGPDIAAYGRRFGFMSPLAIDLGGASSSSFSVKPGLVFAWYERQGEGWGLKSYGQQEYRRNPKIVAQGAIGQNLVLATPMQMALVTSSVANQGRLMKPRLVRSIQRGRKDGPGRTIEQTGAEVIGRPIKPRTARRLTEYMVEVMETGTGRSLPRLRWDRETGKYQLTPRKEGREKSIIKVAAKTGTAQVDGPDGKRLKPHAWFLCFAPARDPQVAVCVLIEHGGLGGPTAGPIGMEVLAAALSGLNEG